MLRVADVIPSSAANGPGNRTVVFFQGCTLGCSGCYNRSLWPRTGGKDVSGRDLARRLLHIKQSADPRDYGRFTFSGGEPFQQNHDSLSELLEELDEQLGERLCVYIFTGYSAQELDGAVGLRLRAALEYSTSCIISGRYDHTLQTGATGLLSSSNQQYLNAKFLPRGAPMDNARRVECHVSDDGFKITGFPTGELT